MVRIPSGLKVEVTVSDWQAFGSIYLRVNSCTESAFVAFLFVFAVNHDVVIDNFHFDFFRLEVLQIQRNLELLFSVLHLGLSGIIDAGLGSG
ncbi:hypothetical protein CEXT_532791 [Caerostris extrusa]|uniref:Uncharacterized protein n=1 Tax=Caerostris extrusa TaxID=172846 RepID=A0AAV4ULC6_CAEEX|nr:hypothetical protein CEXT_532791 [Caerostris extrusa]